MSVFDLNDRVDPSRQQACTNELIQIYHDLLRFEAYLLDRLEASIQLQDELEAIETAQTFHSPLVVDSPSHVRLLHTLRYCHARRVASFARLCL